MPVVWHYNVVKECHLESCFRLKENFFKCFKVAVLAKNDRSPVCPVENVMYDAARSDSFASRHVNGKRAGKESANRQR